MPDGDSDYDFRSSARLPVHSPPRRSPAVPSSDFLPRGISDSHLSGPLLSSLTYQPETYNPLSGSLSNQSRLEEITSSDPNGFYLPHTSNDTQDTPTLDDRSPSVKDSIGITTAASPPTSPNLSQHFDSAPYRRNRSTPRSFQLRSTSGSYSTSQTANTARAPPPPPSRPPPEGGHIGTRNRQSSFRDLVERFNQPVDEIPPLPSRSVSAFSSRAPSPSPSFSSRSRPETQTFESQTLQSGLNSPTSITFRPNYDRSAHSQPNFNYQTQSSSRDKNVVSIDDKPLRRPLFGELLTIDTAVNDRPGHGIFQSHPRRRGSESSISSPHPFLGDSTRFAISPSSPTAWYLGYTHSLEAVNRRPSEGGAGSQRHNRSRSDASWATLKPNVTSPLTTDMATTANPSPVPAMHFEGGYSTKSRIPVASRRGSRASDSSNPSSPPTRTNSAVGFHPIHQSNSPSIPLAPKGSSRLPKPLHISPVSTTTTSTETQPFFTAVKSPGRRSVTHSHGSATPRHLPDKGSLKVYVSAPPPKTSPPLRSSRPRQPVSSASTAASRAKVVERVSRFQTSQNADETMHNARARSRKPPELGNVDFAARRQRIQQAFNRSVQETVKREEEAAERRRIARYKRDEQVRSMLIREGELRKMASMESSSTPVQQRPSDDFLQPNSSSPRDDPPVTPDASAPQHDKSRELGVSTVTNSNGSDANHSANTESNPRLSLADSPTLGTSSASHLTVVSDNVNNTDIPLSSAVTTATDDSGSTDFDPEPQVGLDNQESHRNLLSRIMRLRESSSSSDCDEDEDEDDLCDEELDEKESIQIMLDPSRATFFLDGITHEPRHKFEASKNAGSDTTGGHDDVNRWSMASWASSTCEQQSSLDSQCDAEEESTEHTEQRPMPLWNENSSLRRQATLDSFHNKPARVLESHKRQRSQPDSLIRKGGWDSKTATQLYLQQLARGDLDDALDKPWNPLDAHDNNETIPNTGSLGNDLAFTSRRGDLDNTDHVRNKASLTLRDDWENASPSIADWIQVAAEDDPPAPPPKNDDNSRPLPSTGRQYTSSASKPSDTTSDSMQANHSLNGLGLAIHVQSPLDEVSGTSMPPMPTYSPPPAPREEISLTSPFQQPTTLPQSVSPSIYTSQPPSSILYSDPFPTIEENDSVRHSEDSYMTRLGYTPSPPTVASSATSQYQTPASHPAAEPQAGPLSPEQKQLRQRRNVIKELVDTEYTYGNDMKVVDDIYKGTSSSCLDLSQEDVKILFANSDQIVQLSMNFLDALKQAARSVYVMPKSARWNKKTGQGNSRAASPAGTATSTSDPGNAEQDHFTFIGHVFVENMSQMEKAYTEYLKNHDAANKKLQVLQRNPKVALWLKECRDCAADLTDAWNLDALLVKPVQRLVKYPLLLNQLIAATPSDHPDHAALTQALEAVTKISVRINDLKKRADVVGQVVSNRKRKDSDVRSGFTKAFGRRTEKLRQQVGLSEMYEDTDYNSLANRYSEHFFQLQVVMRDVEMYTREMKAGMEKFNDYITAIQGCIDVAQSNYAEIESKWHRMGIYVREIMNVALPDHLAAVRKGVIDPMLTLLKLYEGPQKVMTKRNKRLLDYARYKSVIDRGDKADKRTTEQGEQFSVLNDALKDELPRLFNLTAQLMEACLKKFVSIQEGWYQILQQKLGPILDRFPGDVSSIVSDWSADFPFADAQILSLALCNGSLLLEVGNLSNFNTALADGPSSPRRPSTVTSSSARTTSGTFDSSPKVSNDLGTIGTSMHSYGMDGQTDKHMANGIHSYTGASSRTRASSSISNVARPGANTESGSGQTGPGVAAAQALSPGRPSTASTGRQRESFHTAPRLSLELPFMQESLLQETRALESTASPARFSGFFSSAMPMSDSPMQDAATHAHAHDHANAPANPATTAINAHPKVLFLAASLYEFNIDKSRREAGYPYLTYTEGEVFDVIAEKGELWLAKNQDDPSGQVGWIWIQHFAKLPG